MPSFSYIHTEPLVVLYYLIIVFEKNLFFEKNQAQDKPPRSNSIPDNPVHYKQIEQYTVGTPF